MNNQEHPLATTPATPAEPEPLTLLEKIARRTTLRDTLKGYGIDLPEHPTASLYLALRAYLEVVESIENSGRPRVES